jgi:hypothetical protein
MIELSKKLPHDPEMRTATSKTIFKLALIKEDRFRKNQTP